MKNLWNKTGSLVENATQIVILGYHYNSEMYVLQFPLRDIQIKVKSYG